MSFIGWLLEFGKVIRVGEFMWWRLELCELVLRLLVIGDWIVVFDLVDWLLCGFVFDVSIDCLVFWFFEVVDVGRWLINVVIVCFKGLGV